MNIRSIALVCVMMAGGLLHAQENSTNSQMSIQCMMQCSPQAQEKIIALTQKLAFMLDKKPELVSKIEQKANLYYAHIADNYLTLTLADIRRFHQLISLDCYRVEQQLENQSDLSDLELMTLQQVREIHRLLDILVLETFRSTELLLMVLCPDCPSPDALTMEELWMMTQDMNDLMTDAVAGHPKVQEHLQEFGLSVMQQGIYVDSLASLNQTINMLLAQSTTTLQLLKQEQLSDDLHNLVQAQESLIVVCKEYFARLNPLIEKIDAAL